MRDRIAEELLAKVLEWSPEEVAAERPIIQALAAYKYDEYQQFSAGSRFIESLALWLKQFESAAERRDAYAFVRKRLIFCSASELRHLVEMAYPDHIRPVLIDRTAGDAADRFRPGAVARRAEFAVRQRQCLFLGLSDGARIDTFRRANPGLSHEQIWQTHEVTPDRGDKLLEKLGDDLGKLLGRDAREDERRFRTLVLLDDFSASGTSYFALPAEAPTGGKIKGLFDDVCGNKPISKLIDPSDVEILTLLYLATDQALEHIREASRSTWGAKGIPFRVDAVQLLPQGICLTAADPDPVVRLIEHPRYYDHDIFDRHFEKGGTADARFGYAHCGLPLVLHHNTPNNSIALLMSYEDLKFRGLFPRIQRHRDL